MGNVIIELIKKSKEYQEVKKSLIDKKDIISVAGAWDLAAASIITAYMSEENRKGLIVTANENDARVFSEYLSALRENVYYFPAKEHVLFESYAHSHQTIHKRITVLRELIGNKNLLVVASIDSLIAKLPPKDEWEKAILDIKVGDILEIEKFTQTLLRFGYERSEVVERPGTFSSRGGIFDIFSLGYENPVRIEFFDDEIDSIRFFDKQTQISVDKIENYNIEPVVENILFDKLAEKLTKKLTKITNELEGEDISFKLNNLLGEIKTGISSDDLDKYYGMAFDNDYTTLIDYFSEDDIISVMDNSRIKERANATYSRFEESYKHYLEQGKIIKEQSNMLPSYREIIKRISSRRNILFDTIVKKTPDFKPSEIVQFKFMESTLYHGKLDIMLSDIRKSLRSGYKIIIATSSENKCDNIFDEIRSEDLNPIKGVGLDGNILSGQVLVTKANINGGFQFNTSKIIILTDKELFGAEIRKKGRVKEKNKRLIKSFSSLEVGSLVVHDNHGIGEYVGIEQLSVEGLKKDYLKIMYSGDGYLYVPVENMDVVQKYIGTGGNKVKLSKLGGVEWKKAKSKVKKEIEDMTEELIALYAQRASKKGYSFSEDNDMQKEFEELFPYDETPDQLCCIEDMKADMESENPMERLICGDVGFGKTEVAIRGIFKAVCDSKQVAFLVPTTILAYQHYNNIKARFSKYPMRVEMLSRFRTKKQQEQIIEDIRTGVVDVIIGTHRILSKDIEYKDLGLLVIDEEQRFGVKHKETLKQMKKNVDVLTLTATPIPRTLHMSLSGIRDMSIIEDPPEDRYPIQTYVVEQDFMLAREWILHEIDRGGQVFFVHNRVQDIEEITGKIKEMIPEARIQFAHGQMGETKLEKVLMSFLNHEFDVMVCTTIIETGLDISNVNTIIINEADKMGLSQLYQLRGRVGRSNKIAYAYLTYKKDKVLSEIAEKRLKAIKEFTELGAGFKISMRDLEIRGAGNLLGSQQHGTMATVGYDMFCKLLEDQMKVVKGETVEEYIEPIIEYAIDAYIPDTYVTILSQKLDLYKKIAAIRNQEDKFKIEEEIEDRFGTMPIEILNLTTVAFIKTMSIQIGIKSIREHDAFVRFDFTDNAKLNPEIISFISSEYDRKVEFKFGTKSYMKFKYRLPNGSKSKKIREIEELLMKISSMIS